MPFKDMPCRPEASAPILDLTHPLAILRYFNDLEFLFLKHCVSDAKEKKQAAVMYPSDVAVEALWKTAFAFSDPTCSYEDFKAEIIALYPEVTVAQELALDDLEKFVADRARSPICSEEELGEYHRHFLLVSRSLISKNRIDTNMQARCFLASFEPNLAAAIHSQLERRFPDHFPADPYKTEDIYKAALDILEWQRYAPLARAPWTLWPIGSMPTTRIPATAQPTPPQQVYISPYAPQSPSPAQVDPMAATLDTLTEVIAAVEQPAPVEWPTVPAQPFSSQSKSELQEATTRAFPHKCDNDSVPPEEPMVYLIQEVPPRPTRDPERAEAKPPKCSQAPAPAIEARGSTGPSETVQKVPESPSEDPTAQLPRFSSTE